MSKISTLRYAGFLAILIAIIGAFSFAKGGLYPDRHEGDTAHLVEILMRMVHGQVPHLDFSTPIGIFAFLPIHVFIKQGLGIGQSFIASQILVAVLFLPAITRVATSRLQGISAWAFGLICITMTLALVHGEQSTALSVSMYYNRWAWVAAFVAILAAALAPDENDRHARIDGIIIGLMLAVMAMIKPTYFVAFAPAITVALLTRGAMRTLLFGVISGLGVAAILAGYYGIDFFMGYIGDLLTVTRSDTRSAPGMGFVEVLNSPRFLIVTMTLLAAIVVLRQARLSRAGLVLLLLAPGFIYVTYQNYGNDPKWLILLCLYLLAFRPEHGVKVMFNLDARNALSALALVSFALIAPSLQNIFTSPMRHLAQDVEDYVVQIDNVTETRDIFINPERTDTALIRKAWVDEVPEFADYAYESDSFSRRNFMGEDLPRCSLLSGHLTINLLMADLLKAAPFEFPADSAFFVADMVNSVWLVGGFEPLQGGAPWYYSGAPGVENADAIIVPICPMADDISANMLAALELSGLSLSPPIKNDIMWVYPVKGSVEPVSPAG